MGSYAFEVYDRPLPIDWGTNIFEWDESRFAGDVVEQSVFKGTSWGNRLNPMRGTSRYPYRIRGFLLDYLGQPVSDVTLYLFRSSDNVLIRIGPSSGGEGQGIYDIPTDDTVTQYYIVAFRDNPPIVGSTVRTLTGSD